MTSSMFHMVPKTGNGFSGNFSDLDNKPEIYSYFVIWAEESADLNSGASEWAFGNGNDTPDGMGVVFPFECELVGLGLTLEGNATCSVEVRKNTASTGKSVSTSNNRKAWSNFEDSPVLFAAGDVTGFKTITGSANSNGGCIAAWFRKNRFVMRLRAAISGDLDKYLKAELLEAEQAVTGAIRTATTGLKNSMRAQVTAAGLGPRWQSHGAATFTLSRVKA